MLSKIYILVKKRGKGGKPDKDNKLNTITKKVPKEELLKFFRKESTIKVKNL